MTIQTSIASERIRFLSGLRAVRTFTTETVPDAVLADILSVARLSGSAKNLQPWELIVIRDRETLQALGSAHRWVDHVSWAAFAILIVLKGEHEEFDTYDDGRISERMMLAAAAHGVGACIGWFEPGRPVDTARTVLGVPADKTIRTIISFGYADVSDRGERRNKPIDRKPLEELVFSERYGQRSS
jgi:nitroreductase